MDDWKRAKYIIINTCGVKSATAERIFYLLREIERNKSPNQHLIVCGCLTIDPRIKTSAPSAKIVKPQETEKVLALLNIKHAPHTLYPSPKKHRYIFRLPIQDGCPRNCSFCFTKFARRALRSARIERIIESIKLAEERGVLEIDMCGVDLANYGMDIGKNLIHLLDKISSLFSTKTRMRIRLGMMNPSFAFHHKNTLVEHIKKGPFFKFLHIPVQTGSEKVCKEMGRVHNVKQFIETAKFFRKQLGATISTDIIVGFPTETEEDFEQTKALIQEIQPDVVNLSKFSPRPFTLASKMKQLNPKEIKRRARELHSIIKSCVATRLKRFVGKRMEVRIVERGKGKQVKGRNEEYREVVLECDDPKKWIGKIVPARIVDTTPTSLVGEIENGEN